MRLSLIAGALIFTVASTSIVSVRADGNLLRGFDVPALVPEGPGQSTNPALYWPIGVAFDGHNLWYSDPCRCTSDIFETSTTGVLLNTLKEVNQAGGLAWDGTSLWVGSFLVNPVTCTAGSSGCAFLTKIDVSTGNPVSVLDLSSIFAADQECGIISGVGFDPATGTFWVVPNPGCLNGVGIDPCSTGFIYNVDKSGVLLQRIKVPYGAFSAEKVGSYLYISSCEVPPSHQRPVFKTTLDGTVVSSFITVSVSGQRERAEDLAYDPATFAPSCALWVMQLYGFPFDASLAAYQIACP